MKISNPCKQCMMDQIRRAYRLVKPTASDSSIATTQTEVLSKFASLKTGSMPYFGQALYQTLNQALNLPDPYASLKHISNQRAEQILLHIRPEIYLAPDPIYAAFVAAIIGNTIDFGALDPNHFESEFDTQFQTKLAINHYLDFYHNIPTARNLLILGDNAGEMIFDREMVRILHHHYPKLQITYSVRGGPMINDATWEDAQMVGFMQECTVVVSSHSPGIIFDQCSTEFLKAFWNADLILSKGQGNFESLEDLPLSIHNKGTGSLYYLLKIKCSVVAELIRVPVNAFVFLKHSNMYSRVNS